VVVMMTMRTRKSALWREGLAVVLAAMMASFGATPALAQAVPPPVVVPGEGGTVDNSGLIPFEQAFFAFEVESPLGSLKEVPIWDEIEQMLDDPYAFLLDPTVRGNDQGWPSYRLTQARRRSFVYRNLAGQPCAPGSAGCAQVPLSRHLIHPLNYNHSTGEELRLLNGEYEGGPWQVPDRLLPVPGQPGVYRYTFRDIAVTPGEDRVEEGEASPDFNSPIAPDTPACIVSVDQFFSPGPSPFSPGTVALPEGSIICGGDPGEPGYAGFGLLRGRARRDEQYSTPAVPLTGVPAAQRGPGLNITGRPLFDPERGIIAPRLSAAAAGGLRRPSLRARGSGDPPAHTGTPADPDYLVNSAANLADEPAELLPSNENDYYRGVTRAQKEGARNEAAALGKALFWEMQVGSDTVQACASCHFHAGADNRTKNQTNPNHLGGDPTLQLHAGVQNADLTVADFPFHRGPQDSSSDPGNGFGNVNDVASSMGVRFRQFVNIPAPGSGAFGPADAFGVRTLLPDIANENPVRDPVTGLPVVDPLTSTPLLVAQDPLAVFQGLRRVEPRNTPTLLNSAMNFDNFWDGRARHDFNGGSVFGPSDPQHHVMVNDEEAGTIVPTRQIIRFVSLASLSTGPALSEFEMSFAGRNWAKLGKKLLQGTGLAARPRVTPLANQLVDPSDSVIGRYSNQGGSACAGVPPAQRSGVLASWGTAPGKPGLCISYPGLIQRAFYDALWNNTTEHLNGCYTDGSAGIHPTQCAAGTVAIPVLTDTNNDGNGDTVADGAADPFDNYVLTRAAGAASPTNTDQFTHMEANMALFFGLAIHAWGTMLVPDDSPFDRFMDANPDSFATFGESGEPGIALDLLNCGQVNPLTGLPQGQPCFTPTGNFRRDPGVVARINCSPENPASCTQVVSGGDRPAGGVDPLLGLDFFLGSNMSLKNPRFRSLRCGECHAGSTLTDHTFEISHQVSFGDRIQEFRTGMPGVELFPEALGRGRVISGFLLEGELQENAQDGIERNVADFCTVEPCVDAAGNPMPGGAAGGFPQGQALFDNGMYNIGVTPISNDVMRGGKDAFGWPLSLSYLALKNLGGVDYSPGGDNPADGFAQPPTPGNPLPSFDPSIDTTSGGLLEPTAQDQQINPGFGEEPCPEENDEGECIGMLPPHLFPWASNIPVGDESNIDEVFVGLNTLMREPMLEGFVDAWGQFNPAAIVGEAFNNARQPEMAMWPNVNRVNVQGGVKAPPLRHVAQTGPYFHNGGKLTLRQVLDFYTRGGDFPRTNSHHRDFLIANLLEEDEALGGIDVLTGLPEFTAEQKEEILVSVVDFLLELTDERVAFQRAPFDQPEIFVPLDGTAPDNGLLGAVPAGRPGFVNNTAGDCGGVLGAGPCYRQVPATGAGGTASQVPAFLNLATTPRLVGSAANCAVVNNHYCR
jgi:cytochrome c peroxidase